MQTVTRSSQKYRWPVVPPEKLGDLLRAYGWSPTDAEAQEYAAKVKKSWKGTHMELLDVLNFIKTEPRPRVRRRAARSSQLYRGGLAAAGALRTRRINRFLTLWSACCTSCVSNNA